MQGQRRHYCLRAAGLVTLLPCLAAQCPNGGEVPGPEDGYVYYWAVLDDNSRPLPGPPPTGWYYNCVGGDRGLLNEGDVRYSWDGESRYTAEVVRCPGNWTYAGFWESLNEVRNDERPLHFQKTFGPYVRDRYQGQVTGIAIDVTEVHSPSNNTDLELRLELKIVEQGTEAIVFTESWRPLLTGNHPQTYTASLEGRNTTNVNLLLWVMDRAQIGDSIAVDAIRLRIKMPSLPTSEWAFLVSHAWLMGNYDDALGLVQDRSNFAFGSMENISATGKTAKVICYAWKKGYTTRQMAEDVVTRIADTLINVVPRGPAGLWPHYTQDSGTKALEPKEDDEGSEWASLDTAIAALDVIAALQMIGDPQNQIPQLEAFLQDIDWQRLIALGNGYISHGFDFEGEPLPYAWKGFGMETICVNWACGSATGQIVDMDPPPTDNGSGFIENAHYPLLLPGTDRWGNDWDAYRDAAVSTQIGWYCSDEHYNACLCGRGWFGLSAVETPEGDDYEAYGVGGKHVGPNDGGGEVVVLHYSAMIADIRRAQPESMWESLLAEGIISPLNNMESMRVETEACGYTVNQLKGSWNLALQAESWALADADIKDELVAAVETNTSLSRGYRLMKGPNGLGGKNGPEDIADSDGDGSHDELDGGPRICGAGTPMALTVSLSALLMLLATRLRRHYPP